MFENLEAYYEYLEKDSSLLLDYNISNSLIKLRDKAEEKELKSYCSYELFFTDYTINNGEIRPKISYTSGKSYPNFTLFDDDLKYIKARAENIKILSIKQNTIIFFGKASISIMTTLNKRLIIIFRFYKTLLFRLMIIYLITLLKIILRTSFLLLKR